MLWDIRKSQEICKPEPVTELKGHDGPVTHLHMDAYKIVTGGPEDNHAIVWELDSGTQTNSLVSCSSEEPNSFRGCSAMAVDGCRIVTACCGNEDGVVCFRDFTDAERPVSTSHDDKASSKFWNPECYSDTGDSDDNE